MKNFKRISAFFLVAAAATMMGCAGTSTKEGTGEYVDDSVITTKVKAAFFNETSLKVSEINVETFKGTVQLSGFVDTAEQKARAEQIAAGTSGVSAVKNNISLRSATPAAAPVR